MARLFLSHKRDNWRSYRLPDHHRYPFGWQENARDPKAIVMPGVIDGGSLRDAPPFPAERKDVREQPVREGRESRIPFGRFMSLAATHIGSRGSSAFASANGVRTRGADHIPALDFRVHENAE
jgi:hypothetical protein